MLNEIKTLSALKGKTIVDTIQHQDELYLKFSDTSFAVLIILDITQGFGYTNQEININQFPKDTTDPALLVLRLITQDQYDTACHKQKLAYERQEAQQKSADQARIKTLELRQLNDLKIKYEKDNPS